MIVKKEVFGKTSEDMEVNLYTLINVNGMCARIINYGAILVSLEVSGQNGVCTDITLGYDNLEQYIADNSTYFGATVGRYAGHIVGGRFILDGTEYTLAKNDGSNHLHGGNRGFNKVIWNVQEIKSPDYIKHAALCLETQQFPDASNKPQFPPAIIKPGQKYIQKTVYKIVT